MKYVNMHALENFQNKDIFEVTVPLTAKKGGGRKAGPLKKKTF